jgi:DNA sulfur modification protein DndD
MNFVSRYLPRASHKVIVLSTDTEIVGPYLEALRPALRMTYRLDYDEDSRATYLTPGYFAPADNAGEAG